MNRTFEQRIDRIYRKIINSPILSALLIFSVWLFMIPLTVAVLEDLQR